MNRIEIHCFIEPIIEMLEHQSADLKCLYLYKGSQLTLIKSTFSNPLTYFSSLSILVSVAFQIKQIQ